MEQEEKAVSQDDDQTDLTGAKTLAIQTPTRDVELGERTEGLLRQLDAGEQQIADVLNQLAADADKAPADRVGAVFRDYAKSLHRAAECWRNAVRNHAINVEDGAS